MHTIPHKGRDWPVSDEWAERHLAGEFATLTGWPSGKKHEVGTPTLFGRMNEILRKSEETPEERTADLTHEQVRELMADPERSKAILERLSPEERLELRAVEAHLILRIRAGALLGEDLPLGVEYLDHLKIDGHLPRCGCDLYTLRDRSAELRYAHFPRHLCDRHEHLRTTVASDVRHNMLLGERLTGLHLSILADQPPPLPALAAPAPPEDARKGGRRSRRRGGR